MVGWSDGWVGYMHRWVGWVESLLSPTATHYTDIATTRYIDAASWDVALDFATNGKRLFQTAVGDDGMAPSNNSATTTPIVRRGLNLDPAAAQTAGASLPAEFQDSLLYVHGWLVDRGIPCPLPVPAGSRHPSFDCSVLVATSGRVNRCHS